MLSNTRLTVSTPDTHKTSTERLYTWIWQAYWKSVFHVFIITGLYSTLWNCTYRILGYLHNSGKVVTKFMNYGYVSSTEDELTLPTEIEERIKTQDATYQNNIRLYEVTLSMCPLYSSGLHNLDYLELACGHGGAVDWVMDTHGQQLKSVLGLDKVLVVEHPNLIQGDILDMPVPAASKDLVVIVEASHAIPDHRKFMSECHRVLRPGGHLCICDFRPNNYQIVDTYDFAHDAGFEHIQSADLTRGVLRSRDQQAKGFLNAFSKNWITRPFMSIFWNIFWGLPGTGIYRDLATGQWRYIAVCWQKRIEQNAAIENKS